MTDNAFARLGVSARARLTKIEEAFEDAVIDAPEAESELLKLKQTLSFPKPRAEAEVRWLLDLAPKKAEQALAALKGGDADRVQKIIQNDTTGLTSANLAADACARFKQHRFIAALMDAYDEITPESVVAQLNAARAASGFPTTSAVQVRELLQRVTAEHASAAVEVIAVAPHPGTLLAGFLYKHSGPMVDALVDGFDRWATPQLRELEDQARAALTVLDQTGEGDIQTSVDLLQQWDEISQPVQLHHEAKGVDEPRSLRLFSAARSAAVSLANDHQRYDAAHDLSSALLTIFKELPSAKRQINKDLQDLAELRLDVERELQVRPFQELIAHLRRNLPRTATLLETRDWESTELTKLDRQFEACRTRGKLDDLVLGAVRTLGLALNNSERPRAALILLQHFLLKTASQERTDLRVTIENDLLTLRRNADEKDLMLALTRKAFGDAAIIASAMLGYERDPNIRARLVEVGALANQHRDNRNSKMVAWLIVGGLILLGVIGSALNSDGSSSDYSVTASDPDASFAAPVSDGYDPLGAPSPSYPDEIFPAAPATEAPAPYAAPYTPEPTYDGAGVFSAREIESCLAEEVKLDHLRTLITSENAIDRFNTLINSHNQRCGSFRYRDVDMSSARAAVRASTYNMQLEAEALAEAWANE
ncbi:MAG: hypothetical protein PS018_15790 [bacterium]|nr:hypothetical protein [bacterium]